ncbi:MAG TPA: trypsin-like peptidase domain-containing protein [Stellaceae bacterium]|nr:trypsin-like peptidase domain-containing protein [Stellaceae bacterium]
MSRPVLVFVASLAICGSALAASPGPDRSKLSYEENVLINTACASARPKGDGAYYDCVNKQVTALQAHPSPDRSGLTPAQNQAIEDRCRYLRRTGVAAYNDCVAQALAGPSPVASESPDNGLVPNYTEVFTHGNVGTAEKSGPATLAAAASNVPLPAAVLPKRPDNVHKQALEPEALFKSLQRSVYVVAATASLADARARDVKQGSAVAVSDHLLLTNCHVVKGRDLIKIVQDHTVSDAKLVAADTATDRCVLSADSITLVPITGIRPFGDLAVGERVFAIGAPIGLERTLSEGLLSGLRHQPGRNLVQTSAAISPGSSGGGLFDERGNLIGITTMQFVGVQNLNFAVAAGDYWN